MVQYLSLLNKKYYIEVILNQWHFNNTFQSARMNMPVWILSSGLDSYVIKYKMNKNRRIAIHKNYRFKFKKLFKR